MALTASIWDPASPHGLARDSAIRARVGREQQEFLLPPQFVLATFSSIGGRMLEWTSDGTLVAVGYVLPSTGDGGSVCPMISFLPATSDSLLSLDPDALKSAYTRSRPGERPASGTLPPSANGKIHLRWRWKQTLPMLNRENRMPTRLGNCKPWFGSPSRKTFIPSSYTILTFSRLGPWSLECEIK